MPNVEDFLTRVNTAADDINDFSNALADKIRQGGDVALRTSNTVYGAAGGAKAGSAAPTSIPPIVKYGAAAAVVYLLMKR